MIDLLAQAAVDAESTSKVFGLTVAEWSVLLTALAGFVGAIYERIGRKRGDSKIKTLIEAVEETHSHNPEAAILVKRLVRDKATKMGIQISLDEDVERLTRKLKRIDPDEPTPNPEPK